MNLMRILAIATAAEAAALSAIFGVLGVFGHALPWADALNSFAPAGVAVAVAGAAVGYAATPAGGTRRTILGLCALGFAASAFLMAPEALSLAKPTPRPSATAPRLKLLTYNIYFENPDPRRTVDTILATDADIVLIQEASGLHDQLARLHGAYPYSVSCVRDGCGELIFSRLPLGPAPPVPDGFDAAVATVQFAGAPFTIVTTHFSWPPPFGQQAEQRASLRAYASRIDRTSALISGDLNLTPWSWGLRGLDRALKPLERRTRMMFSWPANLGRIDRLAPFPVLPIDQIYAGPKWRTAGLGRLPPSGSDHYGLLITLARQEP